MKDHSGSSVSRWLLSLREGSSQAAERLWTRYFDRLVVLARSRLGLHPRPIADEEDVAVSVFDTLVRGAIEGRFPNLQDRTDLWCLLLAITKQKAANVKRREGRMKRGGNRVQNESVFNVVQGSGKPLTLDDLCGDEPTPEFLTTLDDEHRFLLSLLRDETLRDIAELTLEGYSTGEIAGDLNVSIRTVQRKLLLIRTTWSQALLAD
jgi:DNA-directed RNA polymerase specialized sigma24 family protein